MQGLLITGQSHFLSPQDTMKRDLKRQGPIDTSRISVKALDTFQCLLRATARECDLAVRETGGVASLLSGLLCLVLPSVTLLLLTAIIEVRLITSSLSQLRTARHARRPSAILSWASSGLFVLLFHGLAMTLLVVFIGSYLAGVGLSLLLRGVRLRFPLGSPFASTSQPLQAPPGLSDDLALSTRRAIIFVRRSAIGGLGHIAWGFEWMNGWLNIGSLENAAGKPFVKPAEMTFWSSHTLDPMATMQHRGHPYDEYKLFLVPQPHPKEAWKTVIWESQQPYSFVHHNCCDVAYEILRAYGCREVLDPAKEFVPNDWYDALPGRSYPTATYPSIAVCLHKQSRRELATREIALVIPPQMKGSPPSWRKPRWRAWQELTQMWEVMIGHVRTGCLSGIKLITQRLH